MNEAERFHVNQMTAGTFTGNKEQLITDLKKFIDYARIDELMVTSPIFDHEAKLKSIQITKEVIDALNE